MPAAPAPRNAGDPALLRRRNALFVLCFLPGLMVASWITRTPDVRNLLGASTAEMGLVMFGLSMGSMIGILSSGLLTRRFGARRVIAVATALIALSPVVIAAGVLTGEALAVAGGLALFGLGAGGGEIALNVDGADVEAALGRSTLPALHGGFSLGTFVGAVLGMVLTALGFPVPAHMAIVALAIVISLTFAIRHIPRAPGSRAGGAGAQRTTSAPWRDPRLLLIGLIVLALAFAEGSANDWLPLVMVDGHGVDAALGSATYVVFAASMTVGRLIGGRFVDRFGRAAVLGGSAVISALGIAAVVFADHAAVAAGGTILWGLGAALGFPVALSAAAASGPDPDARVSLAASIGYVAFLVGPPVLGFLGEHVGLRAALTVVIGMVLLAAVAASGIGRPRRERPIRRDRRTAP